MSKSSGVPWIRGGSALHSDESGNLSAPAAFGTYRVLHQTGSGVLGPVFRAFDAPRDRLVAVKVFRLDILPEQVVRLADALRRLQSAPPLHPLIVPLLDVGLEGTTPYLVLSFQLGETLDIVIRRAAPMTMDRALSILRPLAATLTAAAGTRVVHGALHPRDVFVPDDQDGLAGVTGFGIVQALEAAGVISPVLRRPYVAPERATGAWDARADVFSLGVIAHELLTGRRPAPDGEQDGVFAKELAPEHRVRLRRVLSTALADHPDQRFGSSEALINALDEVGQRPAVSKAPVVAAEKGLGDLFPEHEAQKTSEVFFVSENKEKASEVFSPPNDPADEFLPEVSVPAGVIAPAAVPVPAAPSANPWLDDALASPAYEVPVGVFGAPVMPRAARPAPWAKTIFYAAAGVLIGVGGALWVASDRSGTREPTAPEPLAANVASRGPVQASPAPAEPRDVPVDAPDVRPAVAPGRLVVRSQPSGALVTIDGRRFGETPVVARGLPPGTYAVRVAHPGHVPRTERVTIHPTAPVRTLSVTLAPGLETTSGPTPTTTRGAIDVDSRPRGARVIVDGRFVGLSPLRLADVGPGDHQVTLELGGYRSATGRVQVDAGGTAELTATLRAIE